MSDPASMRFFIPYPSPMATAIVSQAISSRTYFHEAQRSVSAGEPNIFPCFVSCFQNTGDSCLHECAGMPMCNNMEVHREPQRNRTSISDSQKEPTPHL
jgi:hypothetical protein